MQGNGVGVEVNSLHKSYGRAVALGGVDLSIAPGEFMTLLGPSGSGKTTMLNIIAGFVNADSGAVLAGGIDLLDVAAHKREIGVVFQQYSLFPHMTVFGNVAFPLRQRRVKREDERRRVAEVLEIVGLGQMAQRYPRELSGGQQQRVALARALVFGPRLLLLDEPLGALDKRLREDLQLEIKRIHAEVGTTFIFVTHDQEEALVMSDRIAVFNDGQIEQVGTPQEIYASPQTLFTAEFVGDSNVFRGELVDGDDGYRLVTASASLAAPSCARDFHAEAGSVEEVALVVRPEYVSVHPTSAGVLHRRDQLEGQVVEVVYLGRRRRLVVSASGHRVLADESAQGSCEVGESVTITWSPDRASLLRL